MFEVGKSYVNTQSGKTAKCVYINNRHQIMVLEGRSGLYSPPLTTPYWKETRKHKYWSMIVQLTNDPNHIGVLTYNNRPLSKPGDGYGATGKILAIQEHEWVEAT